MEKTNQIQLIAYPVKRSLIEGVDLAKIYNPIWYAQNVNPITPIPISSLAENTEDTVLGLLRNSGTDYTDLKAYITYLVKNNDENEQLFTYHVLNYITEDEFMTIPIKPLKLMSIDEFYRFTKRINNPLSEKLKDFDKSKSAYDYIQDTITKTT